MVSKVNGIKIYPKHSLGCILSASFGTFVGFMLLIGLTLFPIFGATINGQIMQVNGMDYFADVVSRSLSSLGDVLHSIGNATHFLASKKYNLELLNYFETFRNSASNIENYAVCWYGSAYKAFDIILAGCYALLMLFALALFIEGIIRLATGTYHKNAKSFTIVSFFLMLLFIIASFITNFCTKYIALEVLEEGETYVAKTCAMQYVLFFICLFAWIGQHWVFTTMIKGKLYVADGRLIRKHKDKDDEIKVESKKSKKQKAQEPVAEEETEEVVEEVVEEPTVEETTLVEEVPTGEEPAPQEVPVEEVKPAEPVGENNSTNNETKEAKSE